MWAQLEKLQFLVLFLFIIFKNVESCTFDLEKLAVENFRNYLRIPSVQPNVNYTKCVNFLKRQAESLDLPIKIVETDPGKPHVIITWKGTEPELPSILLSGHMDVVPVNREKWIYPPFSAHMDENGNIYARGAQDMKSVSIQHIEAVRRLKLNGIRLRRTVHILFEPDEEIGGVGMQAFVKTGEFKNLNVGFALDEGGINDGREIIVNYAEKSRYRMWVHCPGEAGHGSSLLNNTSAEKLRVIIDRFMDYRASEKDKLKDPKVKNGNITSINLTMLKGGLQVNVVPDVLSAAFDIRIPPDMEVFKKFDKMIHTWFDEIGCKVEYIQKNNSIPVKGTKVDESNIYWVAFKKACDDFKVDLDVSIAAWGTDANYLRTLGIPALGFSPINNTRPLLHADNEYLNKDIFLKGIKIFMKIVTAVANA
ncbi:aminoacylase-1-like [Leptopilina heterotoma]|uniref:aminoacylase-1-like n=1 Tax=Leptopilina heterotoma TaxID=63436 RepID=UPI001CA99CED|nr:aminoacylase-1-like [Leptopilina heterotoma]